MKKDLIIGMAVNYTWAQLQLYAVTLANCGFKGDKVILTNGLAADVIENLMKLDFEVIPFDLPEAIRGQKFDSGSNPTNWMIFNRSRYTPVLEYLKANPGRFRNALWCDTRDLYFQTNPGDWMAANIHAPYRRLIGAAEGWLIKDQPHNAAWCKAVSLPDYEAWLKDEEVICTGTIAGDVEMFEYALTQLSKLIPEIDNIQAGEQGIYNYLLRKDPVLKECLFVPKNSEGWVCTGWPNKAFEYKGWSTDDAPLWLGDDMCAYTPQTNEPFCIVHQYDRDPVWEQSMQWVLSQVQQ